ncbi:MAG: TatD family hydrolase [Bacteroidetes bacterium]|nr:TatD family hydrolase [Bacteroidota bacterium]
MPKDLPYIDIHTHHRKRNSDVLCVVSLEPAEAAADEDLPKNFSCGRHPWHAGSIWRPADARLFEEVLAHPYCIALGEVGLDRSRGPEFSLQQAVLIEQLDLAARRELPVLFHCVRAHADLLQLRKKRGDAQPWIIHGFTGHGELASQLLRMGFHLSFGAALLASPSKVREACAHVPLDRLFFETDDSGIDISVIYRTAAEVFGISVGELRRAVYANFRECFGITI